MDGSEIQSSVIARVLGKSIALSRTTSGPSLTSLAQASFGTLAMSLNSHFLIWRRGVVITFQNVMRRSAWSTADVQ